MKDDYLYYYILSYFQPEKRTTISQILHVFQAKRTPSMFYLIEKNGWHHGFSLPSKINREQLTQIAEHLQNNGLLQRQEKGYILTEKGERERKNYFSRHYFPQNIKSFAYAKARMPFWDRMQLFTQVFSEYSYGNSHYSPIIKHPHHQENMRQLFQQFSSAKHKLLKYWCAEQHFLFSQLEDKKADILANQLTGHEFVGKTRPQLAAFYQMTLWEFSFYFMDTVEEFLQLIEAEKEQAPLHKEILKILFQETHLGLSASTFETYQLLKTGKNISEVAVLKAVKENTIKEHILEMAFTFNRFPYSSFVPPGIYEALNRGFEENDDFSYQLASNKIEALEFMHYRLVELERMRSK